MGRMGRIHTDFICVNLRFRRNLRTLRFAVYLCQVRQTVD